MDDSKPSSIVYRPPPANNLPTFPTQSLPHPSIIPPQWIDTFDELNTDLVKIQDRSTYGFGKKLQLRLDYVLCSSHMKKNLVCSKILKEYNDVSDHLPIYTEFKF